MKLTKLFRMGMVLSLLTLQSACGGASSIDLTPDLENVPYGSHSRQIFDFWRADSETETPLLVFFHGGGFVSGDKTHVSRALLRHCLKSGISVMSANYPFAPETRLPDTFVQAARVIQYARHSAEEFSIAPDKIAVSGGSAGAGIALWIAFHDDLADSTNEDVVLRESTRVSSAGVVAAQCSYDPRFYSENFGASIVDMPEMFVIYDVTLSNLDSKASLEKFEKSSPIEFVTEDDPSVYMLFYTPDKPLEECDRQEIVHHPKFGYILGEKMKEKGLSCKVSLVEEFDNNMAKGIGDMVGFLKNSVSP